MVSKYNTVLKSLLHQGFSEPELYRGVVYTFRKIIGKQNFLINLKKIMGYKRTGYNVDVIRQSACLVVNSNTINNFAVLFNWMSVGRGSDPQHKRLSSNFVHRGPTGGLFCSSVSVVLLTPKRSPDVSTRCNCRVVVLASSHSFH